MEVISLQDNMVELLTTVDREEVQTVLQWVKREEGEELPLLLAEHGLAMLICTLGSSQRREVSFGSFTKTFSRTSKGGISHQAFFFGPTEKAAKGNLPPIMEENFKVKKARFVVIIKVKETITVNYIETAEIKKGSQ